VVGSLRNASQAFWLILVRINAVSWGVIFRNVRVNVEFMCYHVKMLNS